MSTLDRFEDEDIKDVFLAVRYLNAVIKTAMNRQGITESDLGEYHHSIYLVMKQACSLSDVLQDLAASLPDENLSEGSE